MFHKLPRYRCHKEVRAVKITAITVDYSPEGAPSEEGHIFWAEQKCGEVELHAIPVSSLWLRRHNPRVGGYFVVYEDGYQSYSPAKAFEEGYTKI